jgi:3-methyladenine DNA glycosylase AlkD
MNETARQFVQEVCRELELVRDPLRAEQMSAYMRNQFQFAGVRAAGRDAVLAAALRTCPIRSADEALEAAELLWEKDEREYQNIGVRLLRRRQRTLRLADLESVRKLIESRSWWDTVDELAGRVVCPVLDQNLGSRRELVEDWANAPSMWTRRAAILAQLNSKIVDNDLLTHVILANTGTNEFFIDKAIGWALRQYARTYPEWVIAFTNEHHSRLSALSIAQARKHCG